MKNDANFILYSDAYKHSHWRQYPKGTTHIYSYFESRGGKFDSTVFYGLQILLKKYFEGVVIEQWMIEEADEFCKKMFGFDYFNRKGWQRIVDVHGGRLPIRIKAVPEGTAVPLHNVLMSVENTDPEIPFITNFVETALVQVWYAITVCTNSYNIKKVIGEYAKKAGEQVSPFHLNDFGFRGVSSRESAGIGGSAHLVNFMGTDTLEGIKYAMDYYGADVCGYSVMAAEHSTVTAYTKEGELNAYTSFLENFPDEALLSIVCDSYDTMNAVDNLFGKVLKDKILARKGKLVVRPDSGYPPQISVDVLRSLWNSFGGTVNDQGYKVLDPHVGVIYGDGIDIESIDRILFNVVDLNGFAPSNIVFGCGSALLQQVNRDTQQFAFKCSAAQINGKWVDIWKDPVTDAGKASKRGRQILLKEDAGYRTSNNPWESPQDVMQVVFENGIIRKEYTFDEVRKNAAECLAASVPNVAEVVDF